MTLELGRRRASFNAGLEALTLMVGWRVGVAPALGGRGFIVVGVALMLVDLYTPSWQPSDGIPFPSNASWVSTLDLHCWDSPLLQQPFPAAWRDLLLA